MASSRRPKWRWCPSEEPPAGAGRQGQVGARAALDLLANPARLLSVTQVGVTLASLGLGWAGENTVYDLLRRVCCTLVTPARSHRCCMACVSPSRFC